MNDKNTKKYVLDANVFIEASKTYYNHKLVSTFWTHLAKQSHADAMCSIDKVKREINDKNTFLKEWANNDFERWENTDKYNVKNNTMILSNDQFNMDNLTTKPN